MSAAKLWAICRDCGHRHALPENNMRQEWADWQTKHARHSIDMRYAQVILDDEEAWRHYKHNADVKIAYGASAAYTISLASLGSSTTWVAGQGSTGVSNGTNKYLDYQIGGKVTVGTTPSTIPSAIEIWAIPSVNDTPTYPDVFDGTDSAETVQSRETLLAMGHLLGALVVPINTSNLAYWLRNTSLKDAMGAEGPPVAHSLFVTHNTGVALNATGGNHVLNYTPVFATVT